MNSSNNSMESESALAKSPVPAGKMTITRTRIKRHFPHPLSISKPYHFLSAKRRSSSEKETTPVVRPTERRNDDVRAVKNNCPVCKRLFSSNKELRDHISSQHYKKVGDSYCYRCCLCGNRYGSSHIVSHAQFHLRKFELGVEHLVT